MTHNDIDVTRLRAAFWGAVITYDESFIAIRFDGLIEVSPYRDEISNNALYLLPIVETDCDEDSPDLGFSLWLQNCFAYSPNDDETLVDSIPSINWLTEGF